jgi:hypothetical protein
MKPAFLIVICAHLVGCASEPRATAPAPARYASAEEAARLHAQAAANFQKERELQGMLAGRNAEDVAPRGSARVTVQSSATPPVMEGPSEEPRPRRRITAAEARYAMLIGKSPHELTPGERAVAVGN